MATTKDDMMEAASKTAIRTGAEYIDSLRGRNLKIYLFGELIEEPVDHPVIRPSINAIAETYDLAVRSPELGTAISPYTGESINRFLHIAESPEDLVMQNKMQRRLGQLTGTCFQRCVGMDAFNSLHSVTFEIDEAHGTSYHQRFVEFVKMAQQQGFVIGGAMTDVKGDRSKAPHEQDDPDMFVRVTKRTEEGVYIRGAKAHQTGCINSHWLVVMPTLRLGAEDKEFAIIGALPVDAEGITYIYGRQSCDTRAMEGGDIDAGNANFSGQEAMVIFDDVFIPKEHIFMDGEYDFAAMLVERFTCYHRRSYVCKSGVGDALIGAAADDASQRDHLQHRHRIQLPGVEDEIRRLHERRHDRERLQTSRDQDALRDWPPRAGSGGRHHGHGAIAERTGSPRDWRHHSQVPQRA
jgi:4-hydroxybutyryl-CoA dehydratase/vinylacetyl-CoA-Delta-isomerase